MPRTPTVLLIVLACLTPSPVQAGKPGYVWAKAWHILPETHSDESGYFSLCEGLDGTLYVGTAKYGENAFLVAFDPRTEKQRIVIDTRKLCGLQATGYAAQAKIHTRNFVGPSGKIYCGSKQGYRREGDRSEYPGGYLMVYDPRTSQGENLGMPLAGQGLIDVTADERHGLIYVVTCEDQHWMLYDTATRKYRELGPLLTPYASTLLGADGRASVITKDFELAQYDPADGKITVRPIMLGGQKLTPSNSSAIPTWVLSADGRKAWLVLMNDPTLVEIDLAGKGSSAPAVSHGKIIEGKNPDCRCALSLSPDGRLYAVVRVDNDTGFGSGYLHHLLRYDPRSGKYPDGPAWGEPLLGKKQFHDEYRVSPIPAGQLGREYLAQIHYLLRRFQRTQLAAVRSAADVIATEARQGRPVVVASTGHMSSYYIGRGEDVVWARNIETHDNLAAQMRSFDAGSGHGALILRLGYAGLHKDLTDLMDRKQQRVVLVTAESPRPEFAALPKNLVARIDMGVVFGDACVPVEGYPLRVLPSSGVMQIAAYEAINVEVLARIGARR